MKHGPIALLEEGTPVVVVATRMNTVYDKIVSNIQESRARGAHVIAIATDGNEDIQHHANDVIYVPEVAGLPPGRARHPAAPAARLQDRAPARPERRSAAEPREDRHRRVAGSPSFEGSAESFPRELAYLCNHVEVPTWAQRCSEARAQSPRSRRGGQPSAAARVDRPVLISSSRFLDRRVAGYFARRLDERACSRRVVAIRVPRDSDCARRDS